MVFMIYAFRELMAVVNGYGIPDTFEDPDSRIPAGAFGVNWKDLFRAMGRHRKPVGSAKYTCRAADKG
jgi:hypothetical protein